MNPFESSGGSVKKIKYTPEQRLHMALWYNQSKENVAIKNKIKFVKDKFVEKYGIIPTKMTIYRNVNKLLAQHSLLDKPKTHKKTAVTEDNILKVKKRQPMANRQNRPPFGGQSSNIGPFQRQRSQSLVRPVPYPSVQTPDPIRRRSVSEFQRPSVSGIPGQQTLSRQQSFLGQPSLPVQQSFRGQPRTVQQSFRGQPRQPVQQSFRGQPSQPVQQRIGGQHSFRGQQSFASESDIPVWDPFIHEPATAQTTQRMRQPIGSGLRSTGSSRDDIPVWDAMIHDPHPKGSPFIPERPGFRGKYPNLTQRTQRPLPTRSVGPRFGPRATLARIQQNRADRLSRGSVPVVTTGQLSRPRSQSIGSYGRPTSSQPFQRPRLGSTSQIGFSGRQRLGGR